jgi:enamine deaminase RidA (YjgF/YER057c/UK114 family)
MVYRQRIESGSPYEQTVGFSRAVRAGSYVAVSGTAPIWPDGSVDPDPLAQARRCWDIALTALAELGGSVEHVVRTRTFITDRAVEAAASMAHGERFASVRPASTMVVVAGLLDPRWLLEVELDALVHQDRAGTPTEDLTASRDVDAAGGRGPG